MRFSLILLLALASLPATAQRLVLVSGNAQLIPEQFLASQPVRIRAVNANGQGVPNVPLQWQGPSLSLPSVVTDAEGFGSAIVGGLQLFQGESYVTTQYTVTADGYGTLNFIETTFTTRTRVGGAPDRFHPDIIVIPGDADIIGRPGSTIPRAFGVRVIAAAGLGIGQPIPNIGIRVQERERDTDPVASCQGPNGQALTDATGTAWCDLVLGTTPAVGFIRVNIGEDLISGFIPVTITGDSACSYAVSPPSQGFTSAAANGTLSVTAPQGCSWGASTTSSWITITSGATGQGNGTVGYSVALNSGAARSGIIVVGDKQVAISQAAPGGGTGNPGTLTITSTSPIPSGVLGVAYQHQFAATGGTTPYVWTLVGTPPPGLSLNSTNGLLSGTPPTSGTFNFTINVRDANSIIAAAPFTLTVAPNTGNPGPGPGTGTLQITTTSLPAGASGVPYAESVATTGACFSNPFSGGVVNWTLQEGSLPPGLVLNLSGSTTNITGTPSTTGTFNFTLRAQDSCNNVATRALTIVIGTSTTPITNEMVVTPANIEISVAYTAASSPSQQVSVRTGTANIPYTVSTTTPWLSISKTTGTTPDSFEVRAVSIGAFAPGQHTGSITISSGATNPVVTVPITLRIAVPANIRVAPESFLFQHTLASPISTQTLNVNSVVSGERTPFALQFESDGGGGWLTVNPTTGETPRAVSLVVNTTGLAVGTYRATLRVIPTGNAGGTVVVPITAVVTPVATLNITQRTIAFNGPGSQSIAVASTGPALNFTAQTNGAPWLTVTPSSGVTPAFLTIGANATGLAPGTYTGAVEVRPDNASAPVQIAVTFVVAVGQPAITGITNAASGAPGAVSPGELVTLWGNNIGPANAVTGTYDSSGTLQTTVGAVQVLFDGIAAPITYASASQVNAIVPFGVFGRTTTKVQIAKEGLNSNSLDLTVADSAPGIFMLDSAGQGAILNQDLTVNSQANGAEPGTIIAIYATGAGRMEGNLVDGRIVNDTPKPFLPVGVRIGGRVADVLYAGAAPGLVGGMIQVNARIPADTPRGTMVPVQLLVGSATSQPNVFVATRP